MKTQYLFSYFLLATLMIMLNTSCDPDACGDGEVLIDFEDTSGPIGFWEVTTQSQTPDGPVNSVAIYDEETNDIFIKADEVVLVRFFGKDGESGIQFIGVGGTFAYTCSDGSDTPITLNGVIPNTQELTIVNDPRTCGTIQVGISPVLIDGPSLCFDTYNQLVNGAYSIVGNTTNNVGLSASSEIFVTLLP